MSRRPGESLTVTIHHDEQNVNQKMLNATKLELTAVCRHFNRYIDTIAGQVFQNGAVETRKM